MFKKTAYRFAYAVFLWLIFLGIAQGEERILDYDVEIEIYDDSSFFVRETILYDFEDLSKHGIFRDIPVRYEGTLGNRSIKVVVESITRDGFKEEFAEKRIKDDLRLQIGKPDFTISGKHTYRITYIVHGAFNSFPTYDELYWNAIPHGWPVPIEHVTVNLLAPGKIIKASCFEGPQGSEDICDAFFGRTNTFQAETIDLPPHNGMTFAIALNKDVVMLPSTLTKARWWFLSNFVILIPFLVFLFMYRTWRNKGRDAKGRGTLIPQHEAPLALTPIFVGSIVDGYTNGRDITADIVYLAEQGFLTITRIEGRKFLVRNVDYILEWVGDINELQPKEQLVANLLFNAEVQKGEQVMFSELQKDRGIAQRRKKLEEHIDKQLQSQGYFYNRPQKTKEMWITIAIIIGSFTFITWFMNSLLSISIFASALIIGIFGRIMPKRTLKGAEIRDHILGFKEFLSITEKERLDFHNAPERGPTEFMVNLPYAIALGVEEKWAKQFEGIHLPKPRWFRGSTIEHMSAVTLTNELRSFGTSMHAGVTAAQGGSGTSGGGSSGGGMGGGGGGSW